MLIDWFTIIAQVINFLILVWLMKRFLYKPILNAIDEREKQISEKILKAEQSQLNAKQESEELQAKLKDIDDQRSTLLDKAKSDVENERAKLLKIAKEEVEIFVQKKQEKFKEKEQDVHKRVIQQVQSEVFKMTRKVLIDLAGIELEKHMFNVFIIKIGELDEEKKKLLKMDSQLLKVTIRSSRSLIQTQRNKLEEILKEKFSISNKIEFEVIPELFSGLEFICNGQKLAWSIDDYLSTFEKEVQNIVTSKESSL